MLMFKLIIKFKSRLLVFILCALFFCAKQEELPANFAAAPPSFNRVVSLSPSSTEILFELGLGDRIVGATDFCQYPETAAHIQRLGGYLDPNYEAIIRLRPDLVILLPEQDQVRRYIAELKLRYLMVDNKTVSDILASIQTIGDAFSMETTTEQLISDIKHRTQLIQQTTGKLPKPRVLISISRTLGNGRLADVYAAGEGTYFSELIAFAGGRNVLTGKNIAYPLLTAEGIISLNPDIIFDFIFGLSPTNLPEAKIKNDWSSLSGISAIERDKIFIINESYSTVPGPRFILLLEKLARLIHPEIDWDNL